MNTNFPSMSTKNPSEESIGVPLKVVHVKPMYKCRLCGRRIFNNEAVDVYYENLSSILRNCVQNQMFSENPWLNRVPMYMIHTCQNGDVGLAQLSGIVQVARD